MSYEVEGLPGLKDSGVRPTALAPMQDVTTLPFMRVLSGYESPDYYFTEYFRVTECSRLEPHILSSITENPSGRPVFAQLIGEHEEYMQRTVRELVEYPVAGVDLNMGCPAPKVYKKNVGGGLLRDVGKVDRLLGCLREAIPGLFTVKMRVGFDSDENYEAVLDLINKHGVDLLSVHGRTVKEGYRGGVHYDLIRKAVERVGCPVFANGNVSSAGVAVEVLKETGAWGVMVGRAAIRNPWIFRQVREALSGQALYEPVLADVYDYIEKLYGAVEQEGLPTRNQVNRLKKFLNFVGQGVDAEGQFLYEMRRAVDKEGLFDICKRYLLDDGKAEEPFRVEGYGGVVARPNCEDGCG